MTRQQRRSRSQYLNACRKLGYRPSRGFVYRRGRWWQRWAFRLTLTREQYEAILGGDGEP